MTEHEYGPHDIVQLYEEFTPEQIVEITGWQLHVIYQTLHEQGVEMRSQGREEYLESPGKEYLLSLQKHGLSHRDMANYLNVSKTTVQRWLKEGD